MKIRFSKKNQGGVLLFTMIFVVTTAAIAIGYLAMVQSSRQLIARSQRWNDSLVLAESGVEEAMAALNSIGFTNATRTLNGATYNVRYVAGNPGYILSTGIVSVPYTGDSVRRAVKVTVQTQSLSLVGLGAVYNINMNGNSVSADSWNSHDPSQSANGLYNGYSGTNSSVASVQGIVDIGNRTINGNLYLGPSATYASSAGQVTGTIYTDWNISFPDVSLPTTDTNGNGISWTSAPSSIDNSGKKPVPVHDLTGNGYYQINDSANVTVEAGVTVYLDVKTMNWSPTSLNINGGTTNSGNVKMYLESGTATLAGNSTGGASGNRPENLWVFGLPGFTGITLSGTSSYVGVVYAPEAVLTLNGGGNANNLIGAAVVKSVTLNGHYDFHYDTSLGTNGPSGGYVISSWQEL